MLAIPFKKSQPANGAGHGVHPDPMAGFDAAKFEALIARAERAAEQLKMLDASSDRAAQLTAMEERMALLDRTLAGAERLEAQLRAAQDRAARVAASQERAEAQFASSVSEIEQVR